MNCQTVISTRAKFKASEFQALLARVRKLDGETIFTGTGDCIIICSQLNLFDKYNILWHKSNLPFFETSYAQQHDTGEHLFACKHRCVALAAIWRSDLGMDLKFIYLTNCEKKLKRRKRNNK